MEPREFVDRCDRFVQVAILGRNLSREMLVQLFTEIVLDASPVAAVEAEDQIARLVDDVQKNKNRPDGSDLLWKDVNKLHDMLGDPPATKADEDYGTWRGLGIDWDEPEDFYPRPDEGD